MSKSVIKVENLSKRYRLGLKEKQAETLVSQLVNVVKYPWQNLQRVRNMNRFGIEDESVFWALKDISFEVKEGEVLGIIGKNGAGKSTLLKILSQITEPTSGKIEIHGRVASLLEVGTGFHPELSGRENIYMNGTILGMTRREISSNIDEIIDFSGVEKFMDTPVKFYSSGMKVRLGFSVAAHLDPEILIIDEVLAVGDYEFQQKCLGKMEQVSTKQGRTVIFVSHNLSAVQNLCSRSLLLKDGKTVILTDTVSAIQEYLSLNSTLSSLNLGDHGFLCDGNHSVVLKSLSLYGNQIGEAIISGGTLIIELNLIVKNSLKGRKGGRIDLRIDDSYSQRKLWFSSLIDDSYSFDNDNPKFKLDFLPLTPGEYILTVYIHDGLEMAAWYQNVLRFKVEDAIYFSNNLKIPQNQTNFITKYQII